ncbi:hypothetical protein LMH87_006482 [Akanthomyces muscarius]|uniref:Uncharacterized protein n=1 Tax=Akanthomyces muscarius TaxID=2231603 RepID=A0A9W8UQC4_AKAMU|nr:hypothetical protein LMH87_006482 [Akanthomyces muscarius]KAJ4164827.1 hypothetical protein LMH87_006482 [Akanthomyces muscarius]
MFNSGRAIIVFNLQGTRRPCDGSHNAMLLAYLLWQRCSFMQIYEHTKTMYNLESLLYYLTVIRKMHECLLRVKLLLMSLAMDVLAQTDEQKVS